jgi:hypothetical protein
MHRMRPELTAWHRLNKQLEEARLRLQTQSVTRSAGCEPSELAAHVESLQQRCDLALDAVYSAIAANPVHEVEVPLPVGRASDTHH